MGRLAFTQPLFLAALAAIAIPIIIHLIYRRKAIRWRFAAFEFLLRSHRRVARRLQLKQWILLFLRCLLYALLAFAFAKPFMQRAQGANPSMPQAIVIIVDESMSMRYKEGNQSLFQQAKQNALSYIRKLRGEDRVALLRASSSPRTLPLEQQELSIDKTPVLSKLSKWEASYRATDLPATLRRAAAILENVKGLQPKIVVFSDFARHAFDGSSQPKLPPLPPVELFPIRPKKAKNNAVTQLTMKAAPFAGTNAYRLTVTVRNYSDSTIKDLPIKMRLGNRDRVKGFIKVKANSTAQKQFVVRLAQAGIYSGYVEIGKDPLQADNRRYFALQARQKPKVLLVNGDPRTIPYLDEQYYIERALLDPRAPMIVKSVHANSKLPDPAEFQAIFLCNVREIPTAWRDRLNTYVRNGGGLFLSVGDQVNPAAYNQLFGDLLPRYLRGVALAAQRPDGTGIALQRQFGEIKATHPIFQQLYSEGFVFQSARIIRLMLVEPRQAKQEGQVLWRYSHGPPALIERRVGQGRVLLYTTTIDRDWTNAPIRPFFEPWIHKVASYLSGGARFKQAPSLLVGQTTRMPQVPGQGPVQAIGPSSKAVWLQPSQNGYTFPGGSTPGTYQLDRSGKKLPLLPLVINVDSRESDPTPLATKQLASVGTVAAVSSASGLSRQSERLWPMIFFLLIFVFLTEALVLRFM